MSVGWVDSAAAALAADSAADLEVGWEADLAAARAAALEVGWEVDLEVGLEVGSAAD